MRIEVLGWHALIGDDGIEHRNAIELLGTPQTPVPEATGPRTFLVALVAAPSLAGLDTCELEEVQRSIGRRLLREDTSRVKQAEDTVGHGDG